MKEVLSELGWCMCAAPLGLVVGGVIAWRRFRESMQQKWLAGVKAELAKTTVVKHPSPAACEASTGRSGGESGASRTGICPTTLPKDTGPRPRLKKDLN